MLIITRQLCSYSLARQEKRHDKMYMYMCNINNITHAIYYKAYVKNHTANCLCNTGPSIKHFQLQLIANYLHNSYSTTRLNLITYWYVCLHSPAIKLALRLSSMFAQRQSQLIRISAHNVFRNDDCVLSPPALSLGAVQSAKLALRLGTITARTQSRTYKITLLFLAAASSDLYAPGYIQPSIQSDIHLAQPQPGCGLDLIVSKLMKWQPAL